MHTQLDAKSRNLYSIIFRILIGALFSLGIFFFNACKGKSSRKSDIANLDTATVKKLTDSAFAFYTSHPDSGLIVGMEALELSKKIKWIRGQALANNSIASNYFAKSRFDSAGFFFYSALLLNFSVDNKKAMASNLSNLGSVYTQISDYENAAIYFDSAYKMYSSLSDKYLYENAVVLSNLGACYYSLHKYDKAKAKALEAIALFKTSGREDAATEAINNLAAVQYVEHNYQDAYSNFSKVEKFYSEPGNEIYLAPVLISKALIYLNCPDSDLAAFRINSYNRFDTSFSLIKQAEQRAQNLGDSLTIVDVYSAMTNYYENKSNFNKALEYHKKYHSLSDSMSNIAVKNKIAFQKGKVDYAMAKLIDQWNEEQLTQKEEYETLMTTFGVIAFSILMFFIAFVLFKFKMPPYFVTSLGFIAVVSFVECIMFGIHYLAHHYISQRPILILPILVVIGMIVSPIHEIIMSHLRTNIIIKKIVLSSSSNTEKDS